MSYVADPRVDAYIERLPEWQQAICREVRSLVHAADPEVVETIKRTDRPYFVLDGNICALLAAKDHVNVFLYDGGIVPDPEGVITGGKDNTTARTVAIRQGEPIKAAALTAIVRQIIANNRAGGWRRLKSAAGGPGGGDRYAPTPESQSNRARKPKAGRGPEDDVGRWAPGQVEDVAHVALQGIPRARKPRQPKGEAVGG